MGSVSNADATLPEAVVPKREPSIERYSSCSASTPGQAEGAGAGSEQQSQSQEPAPAPKRKGGRKPVSLPMDMVYFADVIR